MSYGGIAAGTRAVQMLKQVVTTLKLTPITEAVAIPFFMQHLHDGVFEANDSINGMATAMLNETERMARVLQALRAPVL